MGKNEGISGVDTLDTWLLKCQRIIIMMKNRSQMRRRPYEITTPQFPTSSVPPFLPTTTAWFGRLVSAFSHLVLVRNDQKRDSLDELFLYVELIEIKIYFLVILQSLSNLMLGGLISDWSRQKVTRGDNPQQEMFLLEITKQHTKWWVVVYIFPLYGIIAAHWIFSFLAFKPA